MLHVLFHFTFRVIKEVTVTFLHHTRLDHYNPLPGFLHDKNHHSKNIATTHLDCLHLFIRLAAWPKKAYSGERKYTRGHGLKMTFPRW